MNSPGLNSTRSRVDWIIGRRGTYVESRMDTIILSPGTVYTFDRLNKQGETNHWGLTICMQYSETKFIFSTLYRFDSLILSCWMKIQWTATFKDFLIIHFNVHKFTYITFTVATAIRNHYSHAPDWAEGGVGRREEGGFVWKMELTLTQSKWFNASSQFHHGFNSYCLELKNWWNFRFCFAPNTFNILPFSPLNPPPSRRHPSTILTL